MNREEFLKQAKPILFNTEMVKAILEGRKTVTRRLLKLPNHIKQSEDGLYTLFTEGTCYENQSMEQIKEYIKPPFKKGDYLYVRETFSPVRIKPRRYLYKVGCEEANNLPIKWRPSIHMPKDAARLFLKITDVRVERLQDITEEQATREGCQAGFHEYKGAIWGQEDTDEWTAVEAFGDLWNSTVKKADLDKYGWEANPWVWVVEFERVEA